MKLPKTNENTENTNQVEALLRASAAWEPDAPLPFDFADFAQQALAGRKPKRARFAPVLRGSLVGACAAACALGGLFSLLNGASRAPREIHENGENRLVLHAAPLQTATAPAPQTFVRAALADIEKTAPKAKRAAPTPAALVQTLPFPRPVRRIRRANRGHVFPVSAKAIAAARPVRASLPVSAAAHAQNGAVWTTETVERPAWGALVPLTVACSVPSAEPGGETTDALVPVVLDVALPNKSEEPNPVLSAAAAEE